MAREAARGDVETIEPSQLEQGYVRRVAESKATIPHAYLEAEAEPGGEGPDTAAIVRAAGLALREFPRVNGCYRDGRFELYSRANVGVATAVEQAVVHPVIHDADAKDHAEIAAELARLAGRARDGSITQPELSGATFSLAEAPFGISRASAVIQRGQAAFLTAGSIRPDGQMTLSLACDNRILQGPEAAGFLARVAALLSGEGARAGGTSSRS